MHTITTRTLTVPADLETPVGIYLKLRDLYPQSVLLESSDYHTSNGSSSIIGICPIASFEVKNGSVIESFPDGTSVTTPASRGVVISRLRDYLRSYHLDGEGVTAANGLLGFTAYDAVRYFESVDIRPREPMMAGIPDMLYILFRFIIEVNHYKNEMTVVENIPAGGSSELESLLSAIKCSSAMAAYPFKAVGEPSSTLTDSEYIEMVRAGIDHARRGDTFQVVLSRRFAREFRGDEFNVYRALRCINPSPYLFYFDMGGFKLFGSSPETHLRVKDGHAYIDPIAGTFRRTGNDERDRELARALLADEKENAEHIMLVDLARNDLARSGGKVEIEFLRQIQFYSHVIHMVSRVGASLPPQADIYALFAATFPAGTLSGAPKVRAMQIINELEPHSRVLYGGCIGSLGFDGSLNQAITIRSFLSLGGRLYSQAGAGIVAASNPASELAEVSGKLGALNRAIDYAPQF